MAVHQRIVVVVDLAGVEQQRVLALQAEVDVALEGDGAGVERAGGHDDLAAALLADVIDGRLDCGGIELIVIGDRAEVEHVHLVIREDRIADMREDLLSHVPGEASFLRHRRQDHHRGHQQADD